MTKITMEFARQDDCLEKMVPSDLRTLVKERDDALEIAERKNKVLTAVTARRNILFSLVMQILQTGELVGSDWDYISEDEYKQITEAIKQIKVETIKDLKFPTMLRKMWSGGDVQDWLQQKAKVLENSNDVL